MTQAQDVLYKRNFKRKRTLEKAKSSQQKRKIHHQA